MFGGAKSPRFFGLHGPKRQRGFLLIGNRRALLDSAWSPRDWFRRSEPGFWYEAVDPANQGATITMYQDSTGVTPVTAPEQSVGLVLDRSRGLVRGAELWADASVTLTGESTKVSAGVYRVYSSAGVASAVNVPSTLVSGKWYEVTLTIDSIATAGTGIKLASTAGTPTWTTTGAKRAFMLANATSASITINSGVATDYQISAVSFKLVDGAHASQSVSASRPVISQRYNLLTKTEDLSDPAWTLTNAAVSATGVTDPSGGTAASTIAFTGTGTALQSTADAAAILSGASNRQMVYFKGSGNIRVYAQCGGGTYQAELQTIALTDEWQLVANTLVNSDAKANIQFVVDNNTAGAAASVSIAFPDLRLTIDTTKGMPAYQRVNTATDYDTAGFLPYFKFDGFDDSWQTAAIDFTSTDKVTVASGLAKLSDAAAGVLCELTASSSANAGSFALFAPDSAAARYLWRSKGTVAADVTGAATAPVTSVVAATGDIAGDSSTLRVNGVAATPTTTDQGTGNFVSAALNIGRRNNASLPFNGRLSVLLGRGAASNDGQIIKAERYSQRRTGASF